MAPVNPTPPRMVLPLRFRPGGRNGLCLAAAIALLLLAAACGGGSNDVPRSASPGNAEESSGLPHRIVSLSPGLTEILFAIGAGDQVIGVDTESGFPEEAAGRTKIDAANPDLDALTKLKPDLVVTMAAPSGAEQILENAGFPVLALNIPASFNELFSQIDQLAAATGHVDKSDALVEQLDARVLAVLQKVGPSPGPRVYHELSTDMTTASSVTFPGELYLILNAVSIGSDSPQPYPQLTTAQILQADPEVIILAYAGASPQSVKSRPGWAGVSAVRDGRVFAVDPAIVGRPGPRLVDGLETLARLLYPSVFPAAR
jgi:iron complex transport system substrate-binding protein